MKGLDAHGVPRVGKRDYQVKIKARILALSRHLLRTENPAGSGWTGLTGTIMQTARLQPAPGWRSIPENLVNNTD
jgi:hypothetical protein